jgi:hypothetical protein
MIRKKKNPRKNASPEIIPEDNIQSLQGWMRKLEQDTISLSSRLTAVEKRLSWKKHENTSDTEPYTKVGGALKKIFENIELKDHDPLQKEFDSLDKAFALMHEQLNTQHHELLVLNERIEELDTCLDGLSEELKKGKRYDEPFLEDLRERMTRVEQKQPTPVILGGIEIPIELSGFIGGILAFIIAVIISMGESNIIVTPWFISLIGGVLIGSALLKTLHRSSKNGLFVKKSKEFTSTVEER